MHLRVTNTTDHGLEITLEASYGLLQDGIVGVNPANFETHDAVIEE
jgi:hypothetical protein